jgi:hypothetical protein
VLTRRHVREDRKAECGIQFVRCLGELKYEIFAVMSQLECEKSGLVSELVSEIFVQGTEIVLSYRIKELLCFWTLSIVLFLFKT